MSRKTENVVYRAGCRGELMQAAIPCKLKSQSTPTVYACLLLSDGMRRPVSDGMLYAPKLSTRSKRKR
jgi:hypothetical protein